jgi:hypothetical protein
MPMAEPATFGPEELDRIEDALESLEFAERIDDPSTAVAARLQEYRELLVATRDALPMQEVPAGLLDGVLAEARRATPALEPATAPALGWWTRFRRTLLIPATALAGTAALVLFIARPDQSQEDVAMTASAEKAATPARDTAAPRGNAAAAAAPEPEPAAEPALAIEGEVSDADASDVVPQSPPAAAAAPQGTLDNLMAKEITEAPGSAEERQQEAKREAPAEVEPNVLPGWDLIDRADAARAAGDCRSARDDYSVAAEDDDAAVRARAYAGIGFCDNAAGNSDAAEENFAKARGLDGAVAPFIDGETSKPYQSATKKSSRSKSKPKARAPTEKNDPFSGL